jgi:hypothetical protein
MITINKLGGQVNTKETEFRGKSDDTKPIDISISNGSIFYEMDTQNVYMYDNEESTWILQ